jgi:glycosyltransferase involved in cell wall biosynthesis
MFFSFIIPTFNRLNLVINAIESAKKFINFDNNYEIIVIDDCSIDNTFNILCDNYKLDIEKGNLRIIKLDENSGVVKARNEGAKIAKGQWLIFLDSDNEIICDNKIEFENILINTSSILVMFRCIDDYNNLIGPLELNSVMSYKIAINNDYSETLGVCKKEFYLEEYTKKDVVGLRRFESIAFYRLLKKYEPFQISNLVMRKYSYNANDRLSSSKGVMKDSYLFLKGYVILIKDHFWYMGIKRLTKCIAAVCFYALHTIINKIFFRY